MQKQTKMDTYKLFEYLTWADLVIHQDEHKAVQEFQIKELKHKDLRAVCSHHKINGVKYTSKEAILQKIVTIYKSKVWQACGQSRGNSCSNKKEPQCLY